MKTDVKREPWKELPLRTTDAMQQQFCEHMSSKHHTAAASARSPHFLTLDSLRWVNITRAGS